jgi:hypothetical protein
MDNTLSMDELLKIAHTKISISDSDSDKYKKNNLSLSSSPPSPSLLPSPPSPPSPSQPSQPSPSLLPSQPSPSLLPSQPSQPSQPLTQSIPLQAIKKPNDIKKTGEFFKTKLTKLYDLLNKDVIIFGRRFAIETLVFIICAIIMFSY